MSQITLTHDERITALQSFGYTEPEAAFLCLAALHGGYFLGRQIMTYARRGGERTLGALLEKAVAHDHVSVSTYAQHTPIYHLCTRPFYAALGQDDNRNRRETRPLTIKARVMALDFVLAHPNAQFLPTEQEKVSYFTRCLRVDTGALPTKFYRGARGTEPTSRYFVDKAPVFLSAGREAEAPVVCFCYVDAGATTVSGFETYLTQYAPLFAALERFEVIYLAARPLLFAKAKRVFDRFVSAPRSVLPTAAAPIPPRTLAYFDARDRYERGDFESFDRAALVRLRDDRQAFSGIDHETDYANWRAHRAPVSEVNSAVPTTISGTFSTFFLEQNYDPFGTLSAY